MPSLGFQGSIFGANAISMFLTLHVGNSALQRTRQIDVEQGSVKTVYHSDLLCSGARAVISLAAADLLLHIQVLAAVAAVLVDFVFQHHGLATALGLDVRSAGRRSLVEVGLDFGCGCGAGGTADLGNGEDWFPSVIFFCGERWVSKTSRCERTLGPAVVDACDVPLNNFRCGIAVELIAHIN